MTMIILMLPSSELVQNFCTEQNFEICCLVVVLCSKQCDNDNLLVTTETFDRQMKTLFNSHYPMRFKTK